jgi:hypothetical protein
MTTKRSSYPCRPSCSPCARESPPALGPLISSPDELLPSVVGDVHFPLLCLFHELHFAASNVASQKLNVVRQPSITVDSHVHLVIKLALEQHELIVPKGKIIGRPKEEFHHQCWHCRRRRRHIRETAWLGLVVVTDGLDGDYSYCRRYNNGDVIWKNAFDVCNASSYSKR